MLKIEYQGQFKKDFKLAVKRGCDITEFQKALDEEVRGRVMSLTYMITTIVYISSAFFSGVLADMIDIKIVWGLFGGAHIIVTILILSVEKKVKHS